MLLLAVLNERLTRKPLERSQVEARRAGRFIDANVRNAEVVSALGMLPAVTQRWAKLNDAALLEQMRASRIGGSFTGWTKFARQFIQIAMLAVGAFLVVAQDVTAGVMIAATILLGRALAPVETLVAGWRSLVEARNAWRRLHDAADGQSAGGRRHAAAGAAKAELELEGVAFRLGDKVILRGVSFKLAAGESLGLIGPSASGKSTLARLIVGVWKPAAGVVRLDGADVAAWPRENLGPHLGYLPQDVELFGGTVAENIARLGAPDATEVVRAAQRAHVHELILRLPKGYDTEIGDAGQALSPGQRQRIALARALYGKPRLVVLDEPNANLDHEGEEALLRTLEILKADGVTVVIIAHRPSLLRSVDKMLVLQRRRGGELRPARRGHGARHPAGGMNPEKEAKGVIRSGLLVIADRRDRHGAVGLLGAALRRHHRARLRQGRPQPQGGAAPGRRHRARGPRARRRPGHPGPGARAARRRAHRCAARPPAHAARRRAREIGAARGRALARRAAGVPQGPAEGRVPHAGRGAVPRPPRRRSTARSRCCAGRSARRWRRPARSPSRSPPRSARSSCRRTSSRPTSSC